jgi:hypothetical protein
MAGNWWSRMEPAQRRNVVLTGLGLLFFTGPAIFATWWYMFSSTPPYQWFRDNGLPGMNSPLLWVGVPTGIGLVILSAVRFSIFKENKARAVTQPIDTNAPVSLAFAADDVQPAVVAFDLLRELLREGEKMVSRCYHGDEYPSRDEVEDYRTRTLGAARKKALTDVVSLKDISRFEEPWDEDDVLRKKAELFDMGRLPDAIINVFDHVSFERLYSRVQRLRELIAKITGADFESVVMIQSPLAPRQTAEERYEDEVRVNYEEQTQMIDIFKTAPPVKVAVTCLGVQAGEQFKPVMDRAGWFRDALKKAGVNATGGAVWGTLGSVPDGTSIWWIKNPQNNDMVDRIISAARIKGLHPRPVDRPVSAGECEIELMIGRNPTRPSYAQSMATSQPSPISRAYRGTGICSPDC